MTEYDLSDLDYENKARLRAEVNIIVGRLRRQILRTYQREWEASVIAGAPLALRGDPDALDALALQAALDTFSGQQIGAGDE